MKKGVHPKHRRIMVKCISYGTESETSSTSRKLRIDTCPDCRPFYIGRRGLAVAQGRIEKFSKKYGLR